MLRGRPGVAPQPPASEAGVAIRPPRQRLRVAAVSGEKKYAPRGDLLGIAQRAPRGGVAGASFLYRGDRLVALKKNGRRAKGAPWAH